MSDESPQPPNPKLQEYLQMWAASISRVLQEVAGATHTSQQLSAEATQTQVAALKENSLSVRFEAAEHLTGEQGFTLSNGDAVRLAQLLLMEPQESKAALTDDHRDAVAELFRQFAGAAASAVKSLAGGEVNFKWSGMERLEGEGTLQFGLQWISAKLAPFTFVAEISPSLAAALNPPPQPSAPTVVLPVPAEIPAAPLSARDPKLELLMDVELDVTLRFGEREMELHEILDLNAGSVVELDQHVRDPVQLLVGGKIIARGEVVVVDGNYGLRVKEIVSPMERIESLRK
jgi:flagellar motor switch protein FliN/FliY